MKLWSPMIGIVVLGAFGCAKSGPTVDGKWSMLVPSTDVGAQEITFSDGKNWSLKTVFETGDTKYITTATGTYTIVDNKLTMKTTGGDVEMEGGTDAERKKFDASRKSFLEEFEKRKEVEDVSDIKWLNNNSFEAAYEGQVTTFHRK